MVIDNKILYKMIPLKQLANLMFTEMERVRSVIGIPYFGHA